MAADKEAKPAPKAGAEGAPAKAPMFSKAGLIVLLAGCAVSGAVGALVLGKGKAPATKTAEADPEHAPEPEDPHTPPAAGKGPLIRNTLLLEPIQVNYQDTGVGTARRTFTITVALEIQTTGGGEEASPEADARKKADEKRLKDVERLKPWITDRIFGILRGKTPENFSTNEMVDQVKQQIRHAINEERFGGQDVVQNVLFVQQRF